MLQGGGVTHQCVLNNRSPGPPPSLWPYSYVNHVSIMCHVLYRLPFLTQFISAKTLSLLCRKEYKDTGPKKCANSKNNTSQASATAAACGCTGGKVECATSYLRLNFPVSVQCSFFMQFVRQPYMFIHSSTKC